MNGYPPDFDESKFPKIPDPVPTKPPDTAPIPSQSTVQVPTALRVSSTDDAVVTALWIESENPAVKSQSFQNKAPGKNGKIESITGKAFDASKHFYFLPGVDEVKIRWKVEQSEKTQKATFELFSVGKTDAIWKEEYTDEAASKKMGEGSLAWSKVVIQGDDTRFPGQCPNVNEGPYQLRLTLTGKNGSVTTAWTYFAVLVHKIELHWGDEKMVPAAPIDDVLKIYQPLTERDEKALLKKCSAGGTLIDPTKNLEIPLKSTNSAYVHLNEWYTWRDFAFLRFKARWGAGPRFPIVAKIFLKSLKFPDGVHSADAAKSLGPVEFLWDWRDKTEADRDKEMKAAGIDAQALKFVTAALKYKENAAGEPPGCLNCHADRGGKRGGTSRVFPELKKDANFPFEVAKPGTRTWGATSQALIKDAKSPYVCSTGVLFQPSRMANDSYQLRVLLAGKGYKVTLDAGGTMENLVSQHPGLPTQSTGMMEMLRQVDARYIRKGPNTPKPDLGAVAAEYRKGGVHIAWTEGTWTEAEFKQCLTDALAPDNTGESPDYVRDKVYQSNARGRRPFLTKWTVSGGSSQDSPVKSALGQYDQWFGCKAGQTAPRESAANFTLPGRDVVEAPYIDPVVEEFIGKSGIFGTRKSRWKKFKKLNPTVADPELRVLFFDTVLTDKERKEIKPEIQRRFEAAGWEGFPLASDRPEEWANENYNYKRSRLVYLAEEMHLRKVLADKFESVTLFHYQHFFETLNADGSVYARQVEIGGVAAIAMNSDLGLSGAFLVWDHPDNGQRQDLRRTICEREGRSGKHETHGECTFKNGNSTIIHEFGHFLHLPHATPTGGRLEAAMHHKNDLKCIMNYDHDALRLCGACLLRLKGWAFFQSKGQQGFDNTSPGTAGCAPPDPSEGRLLALFPNFYKDFA